MSDDLQAAKAEEPAAAGPGLSQKQKKKEAMKRAEERSEAAGYEDPFQAPKTTQPTESSAASKAAAAAPSSARTETEPSGRWDIVLSSPTRLHTEPCCCQQMLLQPSQGLSALRLTSCWKLINQE